MSYNKYLDKIQFPVRQVETLKAQLERTQSALDSSRQSESDLKSQLLAARAEREASVTDMETDQSRYVNQVGMSKYLTYFHGIVLLERENDVVCPVFVPYLG